MRQQKQQKPPQRMKPLDRVFCITAALFATARSYSRCVPPAIPWGRQPGWPLPVGIVCLTTASLVTYRGRWR